MMSKQGEYDVVKPSLVERLTQLADEALLNGDHSGCVAVINRIYDVLERQASHQTDLDPDLTPDPFCIGIPF